MIDKDLLGKYTAELGVLLDEVALDRFDRYAELLTEANGRVNLTAITEPNNILVKHFIDSLTLLSVTGLNAGDSLIDLGTGAGFPGAAVLMARHGVRVTLLDSTKKKLNFVSDSLSELGLSAEIVHARAEDAARQDVYRERYDVAAARAVAGLRELCELCLPFVKVGGLFAAMKGVCPTEEIDGAKRAVQVLGGEIGGIKELRLPDGSERTIILIKKISQTPAKYPRPFAKIANQPLV
ncbi:MAG: 16S rRNA (guanine(527)-N(7))-methyltransferase RsmG [Oscillospiraceae bacterium]|nr:16S rRNA (guanine(527)-N(7))-methyltransferase RsmG [Oscillospiraceae bacterium]